LTIAKQRPLNNCNATASKRASEQTLSDKRRCRPGYTERAANITGYILLVASIYRVSLDSDVTRVTCARAGAPHSQ